MHGPHARLVRSSRDEIGNVASPSIVWNTFHQQSVHLMSAFRVGGPLLRFAYTSSRSSQVATVRVPFQLCGQFQTRSRHSRPREPLQSYQAPHPPNQQQPTPEYEDLRSPSNSGKYSTIDDPVIDDLPKVKVRYLRPAIWALAVSSGIYVGLAFLEAKKEVDAKKSSGWLQAPQWSTPRRGPPTPTEVATTWWADLNPMSKLSCGLIAANTAVHSTSFFAPRFWDTLWHLPARNVNYTQFTSMFVHSGALHFSVNMYFLYNFMMPVGYSRLFEGSSYHTLSFFLSAGVLSGFAQHWATLIPIQKRAIPEIFIRCGGASGALFGILGVFCTQYPTAGLGILFVPVHFDAQYVLPAIMLFDLIGMIRGYTFVNFGHAVCYSIFQ